jgi:hypothetical protein
VKCIQKQALPGIGGFGSLSLSYGEQLFAYIEGQPWSGAYVYWEVQVVREGDSYSDGSYFMGMVDDPSAPGQKLFVVGRING